MTNKPDVDGQGASNANSDVSGKPVEGDANQLLELVKEIKGLKSEIAGIYSRQDKDRNQFREFMDDFKRFKNGGMSDDAAYNAASEKQKAAELEKKVNELYEKIVQPTGNGAVDVAKVIESSGLDVNDPKVKLLAGRKYANEGELYMAIGQYVASKPVAHSPAQDVTAPTTEKGHASNQEEMIAELNTLYRNPTSHEDRIKELEHLLWDN